MKALLKPNSNLTQSARTAPAPAGILNTLYTLCSGDAMEMTSNKIRNQTVSAKPI